VAHGGHAVLPSGACLCVRVHHRHQRTAHRKNDRDVPTPCADERVQPLEPFRGRAALGKARVDIDLQVEMLGGRDQKLGAIREMQVDRLSRQACRLGDV
jgi:hypothetical protein